MRYFLHIRDRSGIVLDEDGCDFPSMIAAVDEAQRGIRSLLSEGVRAGTLDLDGRVEITRQDGVVILVVSFGDAITIRLPGRAKDYTGEGLD